jgi:type IV pilus assembly protein PilE
VEDKELLMKANRGITLIELLVVMVIIGVLAAVAVPLYTNYMQRARRTDAKTALEQLRAAEEMYRAEKGGYSTALIQLVNSWGVPTAVGGGPPGAWDYVILLDSATATTFTGQAQANSARQLSDGDLFINQDGTKWPADKWAK